MALVYDLYVSVFPLEDDSNNVPNYRDLIEVIDHLIPQFPTDLRLQVWKYWCGRHICSWASASSPDFDDSSRFLVSALLPVFPYIHQLLLYLLLMLYQEQMIRVELDNPATLFSSLEPPVALLLPSLT